MADLDPKSVVLKYWELTSAGKYEEAFELVHDDVEWWVAGDGIVEGQRVHGTFHGLSEFQQAMAFFAGKLEGGVVFEPGLIIAEGDTVAMTMRSHAKLARGGRYENQYAILLGVRDGKLAWVREYPDTKHVYDTLIA